MYNNGQWSGHSQKEMADSLEVLVKITPQLPIDNLVYHARILRKKVIKYLAHRAEKRKSLALIVPDEQREVVC